MYIRRDIEKVLLKASKSFQVITLFGSRQVGKTTTADHLFGDEFDFVSLDDSDELALAHNNPKAFFESHPWPLIIDEVQKEAGLLSEIKRIVDDYNAQEEVKAKREHREPVIVPRFSCHITRHKFCSRLCENETNVKVIQSVMGHKDIQTTLDIYAEVSEKKKQETFDKLNNDNIF